MNPRVVFALVRHGVYEQPADTPSAHLPHPLTAAGERQAQAAGAALRELAEREGLAIAPTVDASVLLRAWQTAQAIAAALGEPGRPRAVEEFAALTERSVGSAANLTLGQIEAVLARDPRFEVPAPGWKGRSAYKLPLPGAESLIEAGERVARHVRTSLDELAARVSRDTLKVFVGHGGSLRHGAVALGLLSLETVEGLSMHHCHPVIFSRDASGRLDHVGGEWKIRSKHKETS
ncbi:MAG: histidine phosphatase family protein [Nannocystaceae bacterium]|nr:histidine phosphatase family protein [Myxococcales bacterium]